MPQSVIFQLPRPGPKVPEGEHYLTIGWKQVHKPISYGEGLTDFISKRFGRLPNIISDFLTPLSTLLVSSFWQMYGIMLIPRAYYRLTYFIIRD